ncbi:MAG TPA: hypothetical protein VNV41_16285 [Candidatus Acidoferrales bacterium]|jgi:hypothetical protein|nr:hypothetical protein [Candidatus Acidoferrales bacterium]
MNPTASVKIRYWVSHNNTSLQFRDLEGIEDFRAELADAYVSTVQGRPAGAGGWLRLWVEFQSQCSLSELVRILLEGTAYDLLRRAGTEFILKPFLGAYQKLKERNAERHIEIAELRFIFEDAIVVVEDLPNTDLLSQLEKILHTLAENYDRLMLQSGERPFEIQIPIFEDPAEDRPYRFRQILEEDETIPLEQFSAADYFRLWGLQFDYAGLMRVYDVERQLLIDESFYTRSQYWAAMTERWRNSRKSE